MHTNEIKLIWNMKNSTSEKKRTGSVAFDIKQHPEVFEIGKKNPMS